MAEIKMVSCGNCGYEWQQGRDGNHQCSEHMVRTIKRQAAEIERLRGALSGLVGTDDQAELDEIRATLMLIVSDDDSDKAALLAAIDVLKEAK